jgi:hypothetical protein
MTYSVSGKIQASDINGFVQNNTNNINRIWGDTGTGDYGYGQSNIPTIAISSKIKYGTWLALINNITSAATHQGTAITGNPMTSSDGRIPVAGFSVKLLNNITTNLSAVTDNRLNAYTQGDTTASRTNTYGSTWHDTLSLSFAVRFDSHNAARYFFNCGGQLGISASHPTTTGNTINRLVNEICNNMGRIWLSSPSGSAVATLSGASYTGVYKAGGAVGGDSITNTGYGFHSWTTTATTVHTQVGTYGYRGHGPTNYFYANTAQAKVQVSYDQVTHTATIAVLFSGLTNITVSSGTSISLVVRPPNPSLAASWGTISIS